MQRATQHVTTSQRPSEDKWEVRSHQRAHDDLSVTWSGNQRYGLCVPPAPAHGLLVDTAGVPHRSVWKMVKEGGKGPEAGDDPDGLTACPLAIR